MTKDNEKRPSEFPARVGPYMAGGFIVIVLLLGGVVIWAANTDIAGAVVTRGTVVVESNVKKVQHPTGGIVSKIYVKGGQEVAANQLLIRLDDTVTRANLQVVTQQLDELEMRAARLAAEQDEAIELRAPEPLQVRMVDPKISRVVSGEQALFRSRRESNAKQKQQLRERIAQLREETKGIEAQIAAKASEIDLIKKELEGLKDLETKQLVTTNRMVSLRREAARLGGERGQLVAAAAKAKGMISEVELKILETDQKFKTEVIDELRQVDSKQAELQEKRVAAQDQLKRVEIRAPRPGVVYQLAVHTVGGVINPSEPVMLIVPKGDALVIDARVAPDDIDRLHLEQPAMVRFATFNRRTTPELAGKVTRIDPDLIQDKVTGEQYFLTRIALADAEVKKLGPHKLVPGMPADVQIRTGERTALSYLMKPIEDQVAKAFRER